MPTAPDKHYLYFTKKERIGIIVILSIVFAVVAGMYINDYFNANIQRKVELTPAQQEQFASLQMDSSRKERSYESYQPYPQKEERNTGYQKIDYAAIQLFNFDPNTISKEQWMSLGLSEKTAQGILNYVSKGGRFRIPEDIKKIWGIPPAHAERLMAYVKIDPANIKSNYTKYTEYPATEKPAYTPRKYEAIDINKADTAAWSSLPGIGPGYASRIVKFRDRLGGFRSTSQVAETFGLPDSTFQKIQPYLTLSDAIYKINVNTASQETLQNHPYIRWQFAKVIVAYRLQHGDFKKLEDLQNIMIITPEDYQKMKDYLTVQ